MVKKLIVIGIAVVVMMGLTATTYAGLDADWTICMKAGEISGWNGTDDVPLNPIWLDTFGIAYLQMHSSGSPSTRWIW